jgi:glycosyltransferase involved in cell wall biosynthesis
MKIALVHDHFTQDGGAERVADALAEIFPGSPMFALIADNKLSAKKGIRTSFLQKMPFSRKKIQWYLPLMPAAAESLDLAGFDTVISSSSMFAKGVLTNPGTTHICYCHTPPRFLWSDRLNYLRELNYNSLVKGIAPVLLSNLRQWDKSAADRVDFFISNSKTTQERVKKYYNRDSEVIYPPVDTEKFNVSGSPGKYFLAGGRLVGYKRFDLLVNAFNRLNMPLKIFGTGPLLQKLKSAAKKNVEFLGKIGENEKIRLMADCRAFLNPQEEDFGITAVEAMAAGRPVIAYRKGGAVETVVENETGVFFDEQCWEEIADKVIRFDSERFDPEKIRQQAMKFDKRVFGEAMLKFIVEIPTPKSETKFKNG